MGKPKKEAAKPAAKAGKESGKRKLVYTKAEVAKRVALEPDHIGNTVKMLREKIGLTRKALAEKLGRDPSWLSYLEGAVRRTTGKRLTIRKESETLLKNWFKEVRAELKSKRKDGKADTKEAKPKVAKKKVAKKKVVTVLKGRKNKKTSEMIGTIEQPPKKRGRPKGSKNKK